MIAPRSIASSIRARVGRIEIVPACVGVVVFLLPHEGDEVGDGFRHDEGVLYHAAEVVIYVNDDRQFRAAWEVHPEHDVVTVAEDVDHLDGAVWRRDVGQVLDPAGQRV